VRAQSLQHPRSAPQILVSSCVQMAGVSEHSTNQSQFISLAAQDNNIPFLSQSYLRILILSPRSAVCCSKLLINMYDCASAQHLGALLSRTWPFKSTLRCRYRFHFHTTILGIRGQRSLPLTPSWSEPLVAILVRLLEMQICWRPWSSQHRNPVLEEIPLCERAMSLRLGEPSGCQ
jgi:hypothetical protein